MIALHQHARLRPRVPSHSSADEVAGCLQYEWCERHVNPNDVPELKRAQGSNTSIIEQVRTLASSLSGSPQCPSFRYIARFKYTFK